MSGQSIIDLMGINRAKSIINRTGELLERESIIINQFQDFEVGFVYFNTDENGNSFPSLYFGFYKLQQ